MPTAKDVRDILEVPAAGPSETQTTSPKPGFTLKLPPGRAVSFLKPSNPPAATTAAPVTASPVSISVVNRTESNGDAQKYRRAKNPDGIVRDLYALIGDNAPSLLQTRTDIGEGVSWKLGKDKSRRKGDLVSKWQRISFNPSNRPKGTSLSLSHWRKILPDTAIQKPQDHYAAFGASNDDDANGVVQYTQAEYDQWLQGTPSYSERLIWQILKDSTDDKWTLDETTYLFTLLQAYDLRFIVVADRYAYLVKPSAAAGGRKRAAGRRSGRAVEGDEDTDEPTPEIRRRSIEEIKDRYFTICRRLIRNRPAKDEAARERSLKGFEYDIRKEIQRKRHADSLFHLTRPEIQEQEALYMELKKMEQTERRYQAERDDLLRRINGLESGVVWPSAPGPSGSEGNRVFGNGTSVGIGQARARDGTVIGGDKLKKRKRGDEALEMQEPEQTALPPDAPEDDPDFDRRNNIYRPPAPGGPNAPANPVRSMHQPAFLRSTKLAQPRSTAQLTTAKINALLESLGVSASRLIMPTRENLERYEALLTACGSLVDMKRMVDRAEQELRVLKLQKETGVGAGQVGTAVENSLTYGSMAPPPLPLPTDGQGARAGSAVAEASGDKVRAHPSSAVEGRH
ncbi:hypothetical protein NliqN6_2713 [Naganishia liquefaciens]|uniref:SWR1-complex protein 4 n=1 Tax=Naganishia liquefaciens TaxID=104408 RepID=A0A8H3TRX0_9TREE|nr:hypothetical protein NliqN6_2713 [Naganishia liquefaciens]